MGRNKVAAKIEGTEVTDALAVEVDNSVIEIVEGKSTEDVLEQIDETAEVDDDTIGNESDDNDSDDIDSESTEEDFEKKISLEVLDRLGVDILYVTEDGNFFYEKDKSLAIDHAVKNSIKWFEIKR